MTVAYNPYKYHAKFCAKDGKELISTRRIMRTLFSTSTGEPLEEVNYLRYCPDWQEAQGEHTVQFGQNVYETPDGILKVKSEHT